MASAWVEEESFACSVCLETLKDPTTLPCGHSYCLTCIQKHWDKGGSNGPYTCPQCRQVFHPRPSLAKSTLLAEAMEKLRTNSIKRGSFKGDSSPSEPVYLEVLPDIGPRKGSVYPQLPSVEIRLCPQHKQPLDRFCHEDRECVCVVCCQHGHQGHHVLKPQEERMTRQKELVQMQGEVQRRIQESEKMLKELPPASRQHKALLQALEKESSDLFPELVKILNYTGTQVGELLKTHEIAFCSQVEGLIQGLQQEVAQLHWRSKELSGLADMKDDVCFLKNFLTTEPLHQTGIPGELVLSQQEATVASIRSILSELQESVQELCKVSLAKIGKTVNYEAVGSSPVAVGAEGPALACYSSQATPRDTVYEGIISPPPLPPRPLASAPPPPPDFPLQPQASGRAAGLRNPEPKTRADMLKFRFQPTFDPNTVYRHMKLSEDGHKVTMRAENLHPPDHPERFHFWRQVLCKEPLAGSPYYWEVEWTGQKITIAVAYKEMKRKSSDDQSRLGHNALSWSLYWSGNGFSFWHNNQETLLGSPKAKRIGVYLDQHAGVLNFYNIINNQAVLIHHYKTQFNAPLYPGFRLWAGIGDTLTVCQLD
ncbi:finTRIM family, member 86 [Nothobranchius furzeri]|uniref:Tripartite motif-containing protein 16-like n=3 Tax=Nothobranchius furzeri TaxID=105023 RepID=A0A9D2YHH7_NOTFU|nr:tripartite motif-containing protein 16-like [Nothobranchius furzeri]